MLMGTVYPRAPVLTARFKTWEYRARSLVYCAFALQALEGQR